MQIFAAIAVLLLVACIYTICGFAVRVKITPSARSPVYEFAASYFTGVVLHIGLWRVCSVLLRNAAAGLSISFFLLLLIGFFLGDRPAFLALLRALTSSVFKNKKILLFAAIIPFAVIVFWTSNILPGVVAYIGSCHSPRYAGLAQYIVTANHIPTLNQNFGQSMLASIPMFMGIQTPYLNLNIWLSISIVALFFLVVGYLRMFGVDFAFLGAMIALGGNTALSLTHVVVVDSYSPPLLSGYSDSVISLGSFLVFADLVWLLGEKKERSFAVSLFCVAIFFIGWNYSAPQNIMVGLALLAVIVIKKWLERSGLLRRETMLLGIAAGAFIVGAGFGGMFTPRSLVESPDVPGLMSLEKGIAIIPAFPYRTGFGHYKSGTAPQYNLNVPMREFVEKSTVKEKYELFYQAETQFWLSLRVVFFPLLALCALAWIAHETADARLGSHCMALLVAFLVGFPLAFLLAVGPFKFKWELSRLMMPAYLLGMTALVLALDAFSKKYPHLRWNIVKIALTLFVCAGPATTFVAASYENIRYPQFTEKLKVLFAIGQ